MAKQNLPAILGGTPELPDAPTWAQPATQLTQQLVAGVLQSGDVCGYAANDVPVRTELENFCAAERGFRAATASSSGTDAIEIALIALLAVKDRRWLRRRTKVIVSTFTWVPGTLAAIREAMLHLLGFEVEFVLVGSREQDWTADEHAVVAALEEHGDETLAVVIPSLLDTFPQLEIMILEARRRGIPFIHDGAQTGGAVWLGAQPDAETESFQAGKLRGRYAGEGGLTFFRDRVAAKVARRITDCGNPAGGPLDPAPGIDVDHILPVSGNSRMPGLTAAAALGRVLDLAEPGVRMQSIQRLQSAGALGVVDLAYLEGREPELATIRRVRREIGTKLTAPGGFDVFQTPPIQESWDHGPTYGFGAELTGLGAELGLTAENWREIFAAEGFANDRAKYRYGVRRPYLDATRHPEWRARVRGGAFPSVERIHRYGLMFHVLRLADPRTPAAIDQTMAKVVLNLDAARRYFGIR